MTFTVWGAVADRVGAAVTGPQTQRQYLSAPSTRYRRSQARCPVHIDHQGDELGQVEYLELLGNKDLIAVATVTADVDLADGAWFWSPAIRYTDGGAIDMIECSLTASAATVGLKPVNVLDGDLRHRWARDRWNRHWASSTRVSDMIERAASAAERGGPLEIEVRTRANTAPAERSAHELEYRRPSGPLRHSRPAAGSILRVR